MNIASAAAKISHAIVVAVTLVLVLGYVATAYLGAGFAVVEGSSMEPLLHTGDLVLLTKKPPEDVEVGDIVVYSWGGKYVIHRVIHKYVSPQGEVCIVTKGDNNVLPDLGDPASCGTVIIPGVGLASGRPYSDVVGVVVEVAGAPVKVPYVGVIRILLEDAGILR